MQFIIDTYKNTGSIHHAYCIEGDREELFKRLCGFLLDDMKFPIHGNPDFLQEDFEVFTIDDGRRIKEIHSKKSLDAQSRRVFVIKANSFTREAQNSLLKVFEEPGEGNHFFLLVPSADFLLPTLVSRLIVIKESSLHTSPQAEMVKKFLSSALGERMLMIKGLLEQEETAKQTALELLRCILVTLHSSTMKNANITAREVLPLEELNVLMSYLNDRSSSVKMILEHLALALPLLKA